MIPEKIPSKFSHVMLVTGARSWDDEHTMCATFRDIWRGWEAENIIRPVLVSGHCPDGADAMAERLWRKAGLEILAFPASWAAHGRTAGLVRNQQMVDATAVFRDAGARVRCIAFLDWCRIPDCAQLSQEQLVPEGPPGHYSHGTIHCRARAQAAGLKVVDVVRPVMPSL